METELEVDPRTEDPDICGLSMVSKPSGREWICISDHKAPGLTSANHWFTPKYRTKT
jgi:hypothetical protein